MDCQQMPFRSLVVSTYYHSIPSTASVYLDKTFFKTCQLSSAGGPFLSIGLHSGLQSHFTRECDDIKWITVRSKLIPAPNMVNGCLSSGAVLLLSVWLVVRLSTFANCTQSEESVFGDGGRNLRIYINSLSPVFIDNTTSSSGGGIALYTQWIRILHLLRVV